MNCSDAKVCNRLNSLPSGESRRWMQFPPRFAQLLRLTYDGTRHSTSGSQH